MKRKNGEVARGDTPSAEQCPDIPSTIHSESGVSETKNELASDLLKAEYDALVGLYTHTEDALSSTFNFYLTLLSAVVGAILVLAQIPAMGSTVTFSTSGLLLGFAVLLGIITQDGIVNKNIDLAHYALSINLLKAHMISTAPQVKQHVFYMHNMHVQVSPLAVPLGTIDRLHKRLWWMILLGTHQLFVSVINSLALAALAVVAIPGMLSSAPPLWRLLVGGPIGFYVCFVAHCVYAQIKFRRGFRKSEITMSGKAPVW